MKGKKKNKKTLTWFENVEYTDTALKCRATKVKLFILKLTYYRKYAFALLSTSAPLETLGNCWFLLSFYVTDLENAE